MHCNQWSWNLEPYKRWNCSRGRKLRYRMQRSGEVGFVHLGMNQTHVKAYMALGYIYIEVKITSLILLFLPPSALCLVSVFQEYMEREIREQDAALWIFDEYDTCYAWTRVSLFFLVQDALPPRIENPRTQFLGKSQILMSQILRIWQWPWGLTRCSAFASNCFTHSSGVGTRWYTYPVPSGGMDGSSSICQVQLQELGQEPRVQKVKQSIHQATKNHAVLGLPVGCWQKPGFMIES